MAAATAPPPADTTAPVSCSRCRAVFRLPHETLRRLVEADMPPACPTCTAPQRPLYVWGKVVKLDRVLLAVARLTAGGEPAGQSAVVVEAWDADREAFGLRGYEQQYPNSNAVIVCLVQLVGQRLVERPRALCYQLTAAGRRRVAQLAPQGAA